MPNFHEASRRRFSLCLFPCYPSLIFLFARRPTPPPPHCFSFPKCRRSPWVWNLCLYLDRIRTCLDSPWWPAPLASDAHAACTWGRLNCASGSNCRRHDRLWSLSPTSWSCRFPSSFLACGLCSSRQPCLICPWRTASRLHLPHKFSSNLYWCRPRWRCSLLSQASFPRSFTHLLSFPYRHSKYLAMLASLVASLSWGRPVHFVRSVFLIRRRRLKMRRVGPPSHFILFI